MRSRQLSRSFRRALLARDGKRTRCIVCATGSRRGLVSWYWWRDTYWWPTMQCSNQPDDIPTVVTR